MSSEIVKSGIDRRSFLSTASAVGIGLAGAALLAGCGGSSSSAVATTPPPVASNDTNIIETAKIAEALAVTTYAAIIAGPIYTTLNGNSADQAYLRAALQEEQIHLNTLSAATGTGSSITTFYYPTKMFTDPQTTMNTLVTFEDAFIAAYLLGVQQLSTTALRLLAARIMANEQEHRSLARVIATDLNLTATTGLPGTPEPVMPTNDIAFARTFGLTNISQAGAVLNPYINAGAALQAGFTQKLTYSPASITSPSLNDINA